MKITYDFSAPFTTSVNTEDKGIYYGEVIRVTRKLYDEDTESRFYTTESGNWLRLRYQPGVDIFNED